MAFLALLVYLVFVLIRPQEFLPGLAGVPVVKITLIATAALLIFQKGKRFEGPQSWMLLGFVLTVFLSRAFSGWIGGGVFATQNILATAVLPFFVIASSINSREKTRVAMFVLVIAAIVMVSNGVTQLSSPSGIGWAGVPFISGGRIAYLGIFNDPNDLAMYLVMTLPLAVYLHSSSHGIMRWFYLLAALAIVYGVYLTNSRGALLGLFSLVGFLFLLRYGVGRAVALAALALPVLFFVLSKFRSIDPDEASAHGRLDAWYQGVLMLIDRPIFGVGHGAYLDYHHLTAHNSFVLVFAEMGMVGYFFWLGFLFFCTLALLGLWLKAVNEELFKTIDERDRVIAKTLTFSMVGFLVTGFFLSRAYSPVLYIFCGLMMAAYYSAVPASASKSALSYVGHSKYLYMLYFGLLFTIYFIVKVFV